LFNCKILYSKYIVFKSLPGFENFAYEERNRLINSIQEHTNNHVQQIGENFAAVVSSFQQEIRFINESFQSTQKEIQNTQQMIQAISLD
jgi:peptidoglycan hydrolase CwlO-like protein